MKIVVCIKQVPDTTEVKIDPVTGTLLREGVPSIINPDDKSGLEAALTLREAAGGTVTVLSMGPAQADLALREALAMGADNAILLSDRAFGGADTWATSLTLATALKKLDWDLIVCGRQAIDGDTAQVGPEIAEHLGIPHVSYVSEIELDLESSHSVGNPSQSGSLQPRAIIVKRNFEDGWQRLRVELPCLVTTMKDLGKPRYMTVSGILDAYGKEIPVWGLADLGIDPKIVGLAGSPTRVKASFTKGAKQAGRVYEVDAQEGARLIVEKLKEKFILGR